jgi:hypothetical protein
MVEYGTKRHFMGIHGPNFEFLMCDTQKYQARADVISAAWTPTI